MKSTMQPNKSIKELQEIIPPKEYNRILQHVSLVDIYLKEVRSTLNSKHFKKPADLKYNEDSKITDFKDNEASIEVDYNIKAISNRKRVFEIKVKYIVTYYIDEEISQPIEFFELFKIYSLPLQTFPYLRELVNSIISRMGLPPLLLPLRKYLLGKQ